MAADYSRKGKFDHFVKITVTWSAFNADPDTFIKFPTVGVIYTNEDSTNVVQVSYDGKNVYDELNPTIPALRSITYLNRSVGGIWLRLAGGSSAIVSVRAWG